jgi:hypothetical protein
MTIHRMVAPQITDAVIATVAGRFARTRGVQAKSYLGPITPPPSDRR